MGFYIFMKPLFIDAYLCLHIKGTSKTLFAE